MLQASHPEVASICATGNTGCRKRNFCELCGTVTANGSYHWLIPTAVNKCFVQSVRPLAIFEKKY